MRTRLGGLASNGSAGMDVSQVEGFEHLVIGGGMANTFLVAEGIEVGRSVSVDLVCSDEMGYSERVRGESGLHCRE